MASKTTNKIFQRNYSISEYEDFTLNVIPYLEQASLTENNVRELLDSNEEYLIGWMIIG